jgi:hypothetical protein
VKVLTVQQPWAWSVIYAGKNPENRTQAWAYRGPLAIHAGKRFSDRGAEHPGYLAAMARHAAAVRHRVDVRGAILGVVDLVDAHVAEAGCCDPLWAEQSYEEHGGKTRRDVVHLVRPRVASRRALQLGSLWSLLGRPPRAVRSPPRRPAGARCRVPDVVGPGPLRRAWPGRCDRPDDGVAGARLAVLVPVPPERARVALLMAIGTKQPHSRRWSQGEVTDDRATHPRHFADITDRHGPFTLDVAATAANTKCARFFDVDGDGLAQSRAGERVWCNPPYSDIAPWVAKAWAEHDQADLIALLLPASRTEQSWWQLMVPPQPMHRPWPLPIDGAAYRRRTTARRHRRNR